MEGIRYFLVCSSCVIFVLFLSYPGVEASRALIHHGKSVPTLKLVCGNLEAAIKRMRAKDPSFNQHRSQSEVKHELDTLSRKADAHENCEIDDVLRNIELLHQHLSLGLDEQTSAHGTHSTLKKALRQISRLSEKVKSFQKHYCTQRRQQSGRMDKTCTQIVKSLLRISDHLQVSLSGLSLSSQTDSRNSLHDITSQRSKNESPEMLRDDPRSYPLEYDVDSQRLTDRDAQQARMFDQYFDTSGLKRYISRCNNSCMEQTEADTCPLNNQVLEMKKWATQLQELISFGCQNTENSGSTRRCCVSNQAPFAMTIVQMTQMLKDVYNMMLHGCRKYADLQNPSSPKPQWSEWSQCQGNSPGEPGTRSRQRSRPCDVGSSSSCVAQEVEKETCQLTGQGCCYPAQWSRWSAFSQCSVTCGPGVRRRVRKCYQMVPGTVCSSDRPELEIQSAPCDNLPICDADPIQQSVRWDVSKCDCKTGLALCIHRTQGVVQASQCERYLGSKRKCNNVDDQCPECITSCRGRAPGLYPSCSSCEHFVKCSGSGSYVYGCPGGKQFDAKILKCFPEKSPTCRLGDVLDSRCSTDTPDGFYHSEDCSEAIMCQAGQTRILPCPPGQTWDMYIGGCCSDRSLTCPNSNFITPAIVPPGTTSGRPDRRLLSGIIIGAVLE